MEFSCDRCQRRFSTSDEPTPGCAYRIRCDCGNLISLALPLPPEPRVEPEPPAPEPRARPEPPAPEPRAEPERPASARELRADPERPAPDPRVEPDPFAQSAGSHDRAPTLRLPLAKRDPLARADESTEFRITGEVSFDDVLRRTRWRGFLAGCAAGALAAALVAAVLALSGPRATPSGPVTVSQPPPAAALADAPARDSGAGAAPPTAAVSPRAAAPGPVGPIAAPRRAAGTGPKAKEDGAGAPDRTAAPAVGLSLREDAARAAGEPAAAPDPTPGSAPPGPPSAAPTPAAAEEAHVAPAPAADGVPTPRALDERAVAAALRDRQGALEGCAAATLAEAEVARGLALRLVFVVEPTGRVSAARIDDPEIDQAPLGVCIARLARAMSFAPFDGERVEVALRVRVGAR